MKLPHLSFGSRLREAARVGHTSSDAVEPSGYCGTGWHERLVRDRWGDANFSDSCKAHDECYDTCGRRKPDCDHQFELNMEAECRRAYPGGGIDYVRRNSCIGVANTYAVAVERMGGDAYRAAQRNSGC